MQYAVGKLLLDIEKKDVYSSKPLIGNYNYNDIFYTRTILNVKIGGNYATQ